MLVMITKTMESTLSRPASEYSIICWQSPRGTKFNNERHLVIFTREAWGEYETFWVPLQNLLLWFTAKNWIVVAAH